MPRFLGLGNGSDGVIDLSSYTPLSYSCSGSSGSYSLTATGSFSAGQRLFIIQSRGSGVGEYEDNQVVSYSPGTVSLLFPLEHTYTDSGASQAQVIIVKQASGVNGSITVPAWNGDVGGVFVMACNGIFNGTVNASGRGYLGGQDGWYYGTNQWGRQGEGTPGPRGGATTAANGNGGGGAYMRDGDTNAEGQGGGGGGYGTAGQNGKWYINENYYGLGGNIVGTETLSSLYFGGGGGGGGMGDGTPTTSRGWGQPGGGIIVVYTNSFSSSASLITNGVDGNSADGDQGGGGAGAGGSVLMKARSVSIGSSKITANGGARGAEGSWGGAGGVGRIRIEACSLSGTTSPTASTAIGGHNYCGVLAGMI